MAVAVLATTTVAAAAVPAPPQQPWMDPAEPPAVRTAKLLAAMQTDEKTALMHGSRISRDRECGECPYGPGDPFGPAPTKPKNYKNCFTGNTCGNTRLMIPTIRANDGPQGLRGGKSMPDKHSTAWPAAISVAASFDPARAKLWGEMMGSEFYGLGANVQLGPGLCLARIPTGGRNCESCCAWFSLLATRRVRG
jgi:beta-glucosidase